MRESNIKVSVWMITYNHQNYISQAIESVLMQKTNFDFEIVIGEDCSTDNTRDIVKDYEIRHPKIIKAIYQEKNVGAMANAFKFTLPMCRGEYIAFLEGDDYWIDPFKLQKEVDFMEQNREFGLVYTDVNFFYQSLKKFQNRIFQTGYFPVYNLDQFLISGGYLAPCTWLIRREVIPDNIDNDCVDGTFKIALEIWSKYKIKYLDEVTAVYRISDGSFSYPNKLIQKYTRQKGLYNIKIEYCNKYSESETIKNEINNNQIENIHNLIEPYINSKSPMKIKEWQDFIWQLNLQEYHLVQSLADEVKRLNKSIEYKVGSAIIKPYIIFNKAFKRVRKLINPN
jgi:glycosyltransferase involved in cell wall biosynthesis